MKRTYDFSIHTYSPEQNRAFINGVEIPGYVPRAGVYEDLVRDLRAHLKKKKSGISVTVQSTGATKDLPQETIVYTQANRKMFLNWLRSKKRGSGRFVVGSVNGVLKYTRKDYDFEIVSLSINSL